MSNIISNKQLYYGLIAAARRASPCSSRDVITILILMSTASFALEPLVALTLKATDVDSVRTFRKKYKEYFELWQERVEDGTIDEKKMPKNTLRCTDIYLRERICKYELGKQKSYKLKVEDLNAHLTDILEGDAKF